MQRCVECVCGGIWCRCQHNDELSDSCTDASANASTDAIANSRKAYQVVVVACLFVCLFVYLYVFVCLFYVFMCFAYNPSTKGAFTRTNAGLLLLLYKFFVTISTL